MANRYWQYHGNSQEQQAYSYPIVYAANTAAGAVDLQTRAQGGTFLYDWVTLQPAVIAALRPSGTNIVSARISAVGGVAGFAANYGSDYDVWETAAKAFCSTYMAQNCYFCAITHETGITDASNTILRECDRRMRLWGNAYYHALADVGADGQIGSSAAPPLAAEYDAGGGHLNEAAHVIFESILRPKLDSLGRRFGLLRLAR